jgi:hypothetical protein
MRIKKILALFLFLIVFSGIGVYADSSVNLIVDGEEHEVELVTTPDHNSAKISVDGEIKLLDNLDVSEPYQPVEIGDLLIVLKDVTHPTSFNSERSVEILIGFELFLCDADCEGERIKSISFDGEEHKIELITTTGPTTGKYNVDDSVTKSISSVQNVSDPYYLTPIGDFFIAQKSIEHPDIMGGERSAETF